MRSARKGRSGARISSPRRRTPRPALDHRSGNRPFRAMFRAEVDCLRGCEIAAKDRKRDRYAETLPHWPNLFHETDFNSGWGQGELKPLAGC
jgi:hypothetical protein